MNPARVLGPAVVSGYFQNEENSVLTHAVSIITAFYVCRLGLPQTRLSATHVY